jgi:hypothetical protein
MHTGQNCRKKRRRWHDQFAFRFNVSYFYVKQKSIHLKKIIINVWSKYHQLGILARILEDLLDKIRFIFWSFWRGFPPQIFSYDLKSQIRIDSTQKPQPEMTGNHNKNRSDISTCYSQQPTTLTNTVIYTHLTSDEHHLHALNPTQ